MASFWDYFTEIPPSAPQPSGFWEYFTPSEPPDGKLAQLVQASPCARFFNEEKVFFAMRNLPLTEAMKHFLVCGATGTGKSTVIDLFIQSIAPRFRKGRRPPEQLIIFDAKCDVLPRLAALGYSVDKHGPEQNVWLLNPYDRRSAYWNLAEAVASPLMARHFAALLVPEERGSNAPYFWTASRQLVYAALLALTRIAGSRWDLRDLLCALESRERIAAITAQHPRARKLAASILSDTQHSSGVISSLATKLSRFEEVAALWNNGPKGAEFSISEFLKRPGVLVLGNDPVLNESLWPINAMLLKSLALEILRRPNVDGPRHWFVLDEFPAMERVPSIRDLVNRGRSKGASVLLGLQGIDDLNEIYQETGANILLEQCSTKTFFRAGGPKTAEWIERYFGKYRRYEKVYSESWTGIPRTRTNSVQYQVAERSLFLSSFFMNLPVTGPGRLLVAVNDVPVTGKTLITIRQFDEVSGWRVPPDRDVPALQPRSEAHEQVFNPWDEVEERAFCGDEPADAEPKAKRKAAKPRLPRRTDRWPKTS